MTSGTWLSALAVWKPFITKEGGLLHVLSQLPKCLVVCVCVCVRMALGGAPGTDSGVGEHI